MDSHSHSVIQTRLDFWAAHAWVSRIGASSGATKVCGGIDHTLTMHICLRCLCWALDNAGTLYQATAQTSSMCDV